MRLLHCPSAAALAVCLAAAPAVAQTPASPAPVPVLTLDEALGLAHRNNPAYLQTVDSRQSSAAALRSAYGNLLPSINSSFRTGYREGRQQFINGIPFGAQSDIISSGYDIGATLQLNRSVLLAPSVQRASLNATEADIAAGAQTLRTNVTQQYLGVLQYEATAALQDSLVITAQAQLQLAQIRAGVGSATQLDVQRAEVTLGQQRVAALQARNQAEVEKLRLFQTLGVSQPGGVRLTTEFPMEPPNLSLEQLLQLAEDQNPVVTALRARDRVADLNVKQARGEYLPTLTLSTGTGGATSQYLEDEFLVAGALDGARSACRSRNNIREIVGMPVDPAECDAITLPDVQAQSIRDANRVFPFDFTTFPWTVNATLTLPIFNGFDREQRVQEAAVRRNDARHQVRAQELQLTADVTGAYLTLTTAYQTVQLQEQNGRTAGQALRLAEERYRVGAHTFVELAQARADYERAETDRINAIYEFHRAYAALENAVGRPLR